MTENKELEVTCYLLGMYSLDAAAAAATCSVSIYLDINYSIDLLVRPRGGRNQTCHFQ